MKSIIAFGDSITFGRFDNSRGGWVGRLKEYFESKDIYHAIYNQGVPGDTTRGLLKRIDTECIPRAKYVWPEDKHIILIGIGINDTRALKTPDNIEVRPDEFEKNIRQIIEIAKKHSKEIAVVGITPLDESVTRPFEDTYFTNARVEEYNELLKAVSKENDILFIDIYTELIGEEYTELLADGLHPNPEGYDFIYNIIKNRLIEKGLLE